MIPKLKLRSQAHTHQARARANASAAGLAKSKGAHVGRDPLAQNLDAGGCRHCAHHRGHPLPARQADARAEIESSRLESQVDETLGKAELDMQLSERKKRWA